MAERLDTRRIVREAGLPAALERLVLDVVRRTRLRGADRHGIALELVAHFADGLDAGLAPEDLARTFGDPATTARLMRRAKHRSRGPWWRAGRAVVIAGLVVVALYVVAGLVVLTSDHGALVDHRPELNASALAVPESERAWPLYRAALVSMGDRTATSDLLEYRPGDAGWPEVVAWLDAHEETVRLLLEAAARPGVGFIVGYEMDDEDRALWPDLEPWTDVDLGEHFLITVQIPQMVEYRHCARVLTLAARRALDEGDGPSFTDALVAIMGVARHARETPVIIGDLVSLAILGLAYDEIGRALDDHPDLLDDDHLARLAAALAATEDLFPVRVASESLAFEDLVQRLYTDDGAGDGRITYRGFRALNEFVAQSDPDALDDDLTSALAMPGIAALMLSRKELLAEHARLVAMLEAEAAVPLWRREASEVDQILGTWGGSPLERVRRRPLVLLMPALSRATINSELCRQQRDAMLVAIALVRFHRAHGRWPSTLPLLVPTFLEEVPLDRFDGAPLRYRLTANGPVLYSVGTDRNDDAGMPPPADPGASRQWRGPSVPRADTPDGDWVLWPAAEAPLPDE